MATLNDILGPNWQQVASQYTYHGRNNQLDVGGAVPFQLGDGKTYFLQRQTSKADGGAGGYVLFTDNGSTNLQYSDDGVYQKSYAGNEPGITGNDILNGVGVIGAGMGLGALLTAGGAGGVAAAGAGADAGAGSMASDFAYGADPALSASELGMGGAGLSGLGTALNGGTGFGSVLPLISSIVSGEAARKSGSTANDLANRLIAASDPFAPYRAGYGQKLQALESSHDVASIPGFQAGLEAVQRSGAAEGFTGSGNMAKALQDYGGNFYNAELQRLAGLAGAGATPGAGFAQGAQLIGQGQASTQFGNQQLINGFAGLPGLMSALGQGSGSSGGGGSVGNPLEVDDPFDTSTLMEA